jgi:hypothetical protein
MIHDDEGEHEIMNGRNVNEREMLTDASTAVEALAGAVEGYLMARSDDATHEERFNEGRYARAVMTHIDDATRALTQLRMRVNLQDQARENRRAQRLIEAMDLIGEGDTTIIESVDADNDNGTPPTPWVAVDIIGDER